MHGGTVTASDAAPAGRVAAQLLEECAALAALPRLARDLLRWEPDEAGGAEALRRMLRTDPGLALLEARVDGLGPSSVFHAAPAVLIRDLAVAHLVTSWLKQQTWEPEGGFDAQPYLRHYAAVACAAWQLRLATGEARDAAAFICGFLHDIGKALLAICCPKAAKRVSAILHYSSEGSVTTEQRVLGSDHAAVGFEAACQWGLPAPMAEAIRLHHQSPEVIRALAENPGVVLAVRAANRLANRLGFVSRGQQASVGEADWWAGLDLSADLAAQVSDSLPGWVTAAEEILGLDALAPRGSVGVRPQWGAANQPLNVADWSVADGGGSVLAQALEAFAQFPEGLGSTHVALGTAAAVLRRVLTACETAVVYWSHPDAAVLLTAYASAEAPGGRVREVPVGEDARARLLAVLATRTGHDGGGASAARDTWRWCTGVEPPHSPGLFPIRHMDRISGAVLWVGGEQGLSARMLGSAAAAGLGNLLGLLLTGVRARDEAGEVSERVLAAERRWLPAQELRVRQQSVAMIAEMAAGAAHELNNPLAVISGRAQLLLSECRDEKQTRALQTIVERAHAASQIVSELMQFAKPRAPQPVVQRLGELLPCRCQRWYTQGGAGAGQLTWQLADGEATVYADADQLQEILNALLANALHAVAEQSGQVQVNSVSLLSDDTARIVVEDNGCGMEAYVLQHAVDPFFSSRPAGRGRGLGLSRACRLAEVNGGRLVLDSAPGRGTRVLIELPARPS
ncbi:MAG TPA: HDOD domain-containing protein [Phycisphaerae bacterium]|nr:HDOD domain-containing protein [Phycisphaerae bacterium]HNU46041.1 HDOD domain-containing protein [Phycisphaerae bacterium]